MILTLALGLSPWVLGTAAEAAQKAPPTSSQTSQATLIHEAAGQPTGLAIKAAGSSTSQATEKADSAEESTQEAKVTLYATNWCGWCRKTRTLLNELEVEFREVDVEKDAKGRQEFESKTGGRSGVPVLDIAGTIVRGFNEKRIRQLVSNLQDTV